MTRLLQRLKRLFIQESQIEKLERIVSEQPYHLVSRLCKNKEITPARFYVEVQFNYRMALNDEDFNRIKLIREITGIKPGIEVTSAIQGLYCNLSSKKDSKSLVALMDASGVPMFDTAQSRFLEVNLESVEGLTPDYTIDSIELVEKLYNKYCSKL